MSRQSGKNGEIGYCKDYRRQENHETVKCSTFASQHKPTLKPKASKELHFADTHN